MNIFLRELKANLRSLLVWSAIALLFITIGFGKFAAYEGNPELLAVLDGMPPALMAAFNMKAFNLTTVTGFYAVMISWFGLVLSVSAVMWGSDIISKEERDKTVEFSLTLPVTRRRLVTAKALAALVNCVVLLLVTYAGTMANLAQYETDAAFFRFLSLSMVALLIVQLVFLAAGILLGCSMKRYKRSSSVAVSLLLGTYFLSIISGLKENLNFLKYFSPFKYFDPAVLLHESRIDLTFVALSAGIIVVCLVGAHISYARRDLYI